MKKFDTINVIPFIDIMLVLLAIVLATASFISQEKIEVNVPQSESKVKVTVEDLVELIAITKEGEYFYRDKLMSIHDLEKAILTLPIDAKVTLKVDSEANFQHFVSVTDFLKKAQLKKITVITTKPTQTLSP